MSEATAVAKEGTEEGRPRPSCGASAQLLPTQPAQEMIEVQAVCHCEYGIQTLVPSGQVAIGVFQNLMELK